MAAVTGSRYNSAVRVFPLLLAAVCLPALAAGQTTSGAAPADRAQLPHWLQDTFVDVHVGGVSYPFSRLQLETGSTVSSIRRPAPIVRVTLNGRHLSERVSLQLSYMRPVQYVRYDDLNGTTRDRTVWMHYAMLTLKALLPVGRRLSLYGEAGPALATRSGFNLDGEPVVRDMMAATAVLGVGLDLQLTPRWAVTAGATYLPGKRSVRQPRTVVASAGVRYSLRALTDERVRQVRDAGRMFPRTLAHVELTGGTGYSVNNFFSRKVPVFWGGNVKVDQGLAAHVERSVFHTRSVFSLGFGASLGAWKTRRDDQRFATLSVYPVLRFTVVRTRPFDLYLTYSMAGPTFISRVAMDGHQTGPRFTFQDFMGLGAFLGRDRRTHIGIKINHYSNGNLFPSNAGVKIPLTLVVGRTF